MRKTTTKINCKNCKKEFFLPLWESKLRMFCSKHCSASAKSKDSRRKNTKVCLNCKKTFFQRNSVFCSKKCYGQSMSMGEKPNCFDCGLKLSARHCVYCLNCSPKKRSGENHPRWINDRSKLKNNNERNDMAYKEWRKEVWLRDNYKCKIANPDCKGRIEAHHILGWTEFPELRYQINNGITLCHAHHPRKRAEEKRLISEFQKLVSVSK